jgi:anthranilate phosphoribosyltransferase
MSIAFREYVKKIGSGRLTGRDLSREESCDATLMLLRQEATPAQIGAFLIAHRIKRPTFEELAGILDAFDILAKPLTISKDVPPPAVLSSPYDGQDRLACVTPLTALICSSLGQGIILHGSTDMPPKHGLTSFDILAALGLDLYRSPEVLTQQYKSLHFGWVYLPAHFPEAFVLQTLRDELGKRPPLATAELLWNPVRIGLPVIGYTHRETINLAIGTHQLRGDVAEMVMVRGVQGSVNCNMFHPNLGCRWQRGMPMPVEFRLVAADHGLGDDEFALLKDGQDLERHRKLTLATLAGEPTPLRRAAMFSSAFVMHQTGFCTSLEDAIGLAKKALDERTAEQHFRNLVHSQVNA